ncbi:MAG: DUF86 domain-containing protein [Alicyclobacillus herbarius]|uniref:DUF86 domain-containing protein n=1 Tax=Alicyclobacillus herbarius TaxID=122960 RepID=UPI002354FF97|nr:HepT-like ribonuclease domain-containing protein [Alicyclobacillus herbarius]MCL6631582.1 DUF86 domain-containing protein [Alicyclobacillus herbarius]
MFITNELQQQIGACLEALRERAEWLQSLALLPSGWATTAERRWAAERALHVGIECVTDAAALLIDALVMRDPGGYADILRVLMEEEVVSRNWFERFQGAVRLRQDLVRRYVSIKPDEIESAVREYAPLFLQYIEQMQAYLEREQKR